VKKFSIKAHEDGIFSVIAITLPNFYFLNTKLHQWKAEKNDKRQKKM
jgi:hypothetical protein